MSVVIETTIGSLTVDLFIKERPHTCKNFLNLCKIKFYNFCPFHKITSDFAAETGRDKDNVAGGYSVYYFIYGEKGRYYEAEQIPKLKHKEIGTLSMVTNDDKLIGSEFLITLGKDLDYLDKQHTVFGQVVEGLDILFKLNEILCDKEDKPYKDVLITHTVILFDPFGDLKGLQLPDKSPEPTEELLNSDSIYIEEGYDENQGKTKEQIEEEAKDKEAKSRAIILEMIGDLPDADVAPPDNVLFVCKLNSVTTQEDLRVIFSRFGKIIDCEIIKDSKTGESLQYGFIEFENQKDCEQAYFKMDNVLIDDRRIHVDFSQSVAKFKWHKKMNKDEIANYDRNGRRRSTSVDRKDEEKEYRREDRNYDKRDRYYHNNQRDNDRKYKERYNERSRHRSRSIERKYDNKSDNKYDRYNNYRKYDNKDYDKYDDRKHKRDRHSKRSSSRERKSSRRSHSKERRSKAYLNDNRR